MLDKPGDEDDAPLMMGKMGLARSRRRRSPCPGRQSARPPSRLNTTAAALLQRQRRPAAALGLA